MRSESILVVAEMAQGRLSTLTRELMTAGRGLVESSGAELLSVVLGRDAENGARQTIACGADRALFSSAPIAEPYQPELFSFAVEKVCNLVRPTVILLPHSPLGRDLAPRLAYHLETAWAPGCTHICFAEGTLSHTRLVFGGKVQIDEAWKRTPAIVSIREKNYEPAPEARAPTSSPQPIELALPNLSSIRAVDRVGGNAGIVEKLREAEVIVSGGRGVGSVEGFQKLQALAGLLKAQLGASKAAVDQGWAPAELQIGMSGSTVAPRLYIAVGISGTTQHMAGCLKAKTLVAINKDPQAPIFRYAQYGIVDEWQNVLPPLIGKLENRRR